MVPCRLVGPTAAWIEPEATSEPFGQPVSVLWSVTKLRLQVAVKSLVSTLTPYMVSLMSTSGAALKPVRALCAARICVKPIGDGLAVLPAVLGATVSEPP